MDCYLIDLMDIGRNTLLLVFLFFLSAMALYLYEIKVYYLTGYWLMSNDYMNRLQSVKP